MLFRKTGMMGSKMVEPVSGGFLGALQRTNERDLTPEMLARVMEGI